VVNDITLFRNQIRDRASAINLGSTRGFEIRNVRVGEHMGRNLIAMWDDEQGEDFACQNGTITGLVAMDGKPLFSKGVKPQELVNVGQWSKNISIPGLQAPAGITAITWPNGRK
jgi:hypothetical protein